MDPSSAKSNRPLSPHLGIYKPQISSVLSIMHRMTGVFLSLGSLLFALWLFAAAYDEMLYETIYMFSKGLIGTIALVLWSAAFFYHLSNGIRHLFWDMGKGFTIPVMTKTGVMVLLSTAFFTAITWAFIWGLV